MSRLLKVIGLCALAGVIAAMIYSNTNAGRHRSRREQDTWKVVITGTSTGALSTNVPPPEPMRFKR